jgi:type II secretory pathway component PulF
VVDPPMRKIPFNIGDVVQKVVLARFACTLGTSSAVGVPILQALQPTVPRQATINRAHSAEEPGGDLGGVADVQSLLQEPVFPRWRSA